MKKFYISIGLGVFLVGCGGEEEAPAEFKVPMGVGTYWLMVDDADSTDWHLDSVYSKAGDTSLVLIISSSGDTGTAKLYMDGNYVVWTLEYLDLKALPVRPRGLPEEALYMAKENPDDPWALYMFKTDPEVGDQWVVNGDTWWTVDEDDDGVEDTTWYHIEATIVGIESVSVPAGEFSEAYRVRYDDHYRKWLSSTGAESTWTEYDSDYWFASGVLWLVSLDSVERYVLKDYNAVY